MFVLSGPFEVSVLSGVPRLFALFGVFGLPASQCEVCGGLVPGDQGLQVN